MKKILLISVMVFTAALIIFTGFAAGDYFVRPQEFAVLSDTRVVAQELFTAGNYAGFATEDKMEHISEAILNSVADELIADGTEYLLVSGDITESGDEASHLRCAEIFRRLEAAGVEVFVINGNHDVAVKLEYVGKSVTAGKFREIYADFGYSQARSSFEGTLSYAADMGRHYRVIAVDNMAYYPDADGEIFKTALGESHEKWVKSMVAETVADGRIPVIMAHAPFLNHYPKLAGLFLDRVETDRYAKLADFFADNGARYAFTGHFHAQDIAMRTSAGGNDFYDVGTSSAIVYPCAYRKIKLTRNSLEADTVRFDALRERYLSEHSPSAEREALSQGLQEYAKRHYYNEISSVVGNIGQETGLLGSAAQGSGSTARLMRILMTEVLDKVVRAPFYLADEQTGDISLERIMNGYGLEIPRTGYSSVIELAPYLVSALFLGDEALGGTPELAITKYIVYSVFYYLDAASAAIASEFPSMPVMDIDAERLFTEGELECYDSKIIPFVLKFFDDGSFIFGMVKSAVGSGFSAVASLSPLLDAYAGDYLDGVFGYFGESHIALGNLIEEGIFTRYAPEISADTHPPDNYFYVEFD